jgi:hypothetical protein
MSMGMGGWGGGYQGGGWGGGYSPSPSPKGYGKGAIQSGKGKGGKGGKGDSAGRKIFIGKLDFSTTVGRSVGHVEQHSTPTPLTFSTNPLTFSNNSPDGLRDYMAQYGPVDDVYIPKVQSHKQNNVFAHKSQHPSCNSCFGTQRIVRVANQEVSLL